MTAIEGKSCPYCGKAIVRKPGETPYSFRQRRYCDKLCGRRGNAGRAHIMLPSKPLQELVKQRARAEGVTDLSRRYGYAIGLREDSAFRQVDRMLHRDYVTVMEADRLCCFLGKHPAEVYGEAWWNA